MRCLNGFLSINVVSVGLGLAPGSGLARGAYVACSNESLSVCAKLREVILLGILLV